MSSLALEFPPHAVALRFTSDSLVVTLRDGRELSVPLAWFPRLANATPEQLGQFEWLGMGEGIHWPALDEDICVLGLLEGRHSNELRPTPNSQRTT